MLHSDMEINFHNYGPLDELKYDFSLYENNIDYLACFVKTHYKQDYSNWDNDHFMKSYLSYQNMITEAIKTNNLDALEVLWSGIYFHDRDNPDFETDVYTAVEYGNIKTIQHVLYGYMKYHTLNGVEPLSYDKLKELASKNKNDKVLDLINELNVVTNNNEIHYLMTDDDEDEDEDKDEDHKLRQKLFNDIMSKY